MKKQRRTQTYTIKRWALTMPHGDGRLIYNELYVTRAGARYMGDLGEGTRVVRVTLTWEEASQCHRLT